MLLPLHLNISDAPPTSPGLEYQANVNREHFNANVNRLHFTATEEDAAA